MQFENFELRTKEIEKQVRIAEKFGKMIDPNEVIEGKEHLDSLTCGGCKMIPARQRLKECSKCQAIICDKCYYLAKTEIEDANYDREKQYIDEE